LILEAARAFLRNVGNNVSSEEGEGNDEDRGDPVPNNNNYVFSLSNGRNQKRIEESIDPPHKRRKQSPSPLSYANQVRAEANEMIAAAEAEKQLQLFEETQRVLKEAKRVAGKQQGHIKTTPRGRRGTQIGYPLSVLPRGNGQTATSKTVKQATALQTKLETA
jgi:hypothetical protein